MPKLKKLHQYYRTTPQTLHSHSPDGATLLGYMPEAGNSQTDGGIHSPSVLMFLRLVTGSTVVLTCCKGDCQSQWKTPILAPHSSETP